MYFTFVWDHRVSNYFLCDPLTSWWSSEIARAIPNSHSHRGPTAAKGQGCSDQCIPSISPSSIQMINSVLRFLITKLEAASHPRTIGPCDKTLWSLQGLLSRSCLDLCPSWGLLQVEESSQWESLLVCSSPTVGSMLLSSAAQGISWWVVWLRCRWQHGYSPLRDQQQPQAWGLEEKQLVFQTNGSVKLFQPDEITAAVSRGISSSRRGQNTSRFWVTSGHR